MNSMKAAVAAGKKNTKSMLLDCCIIDESPPKPLRKKPAEQVADAEQVAGAEAGAEQGAGSGS